MGEHPRRAGLRTGSNLGAILPYRSDERVDHLLEEVVCHGLHMPWEGAVSESPADVAMVTPSKVTV
jgi:hypothetical protein